MRKSNKRLSFGSSGVPNLQFEVWYCSENNTVLLKQHDMYSFPRKLINTVLKLDVTIVMTV